MRERASDDTNTPGTPEESGTTNGAGSAYSESRMTSPDTLQLTLGPNRATVSSF